MPIPQLGETGEPRPKSDAAPWANGQLRSALIRVAEPDGFVPFDRYLEVVLYAPDVGYYTRRGTRLGREGDFYTAAHVHPIFGATLARHLVEIWHDLGDPPAFRILEIGPGDGTLAADILTALDRGSEPPIGWEYAFVERSPSLATAVSRRLADLIPAPAIRFRSSAGFDAEGPFRGVVVANEVLDALPFRRLIRTNGAWKELGVLLSDDGSGAWAQRPVTRPIPPPALPSEAADGAVLEVSPASEAWIRELADHVVDGRAILIDYGASERELLARGTAGSLEAIREHRQVDPLSHPGQTDLSAFVNFDRIRAAVRTSGLRELFYEAQAEALGRWGVQDELAEAVRARPSSTDATKARLAVKNLLFTFSTFRVLELGPPRSEG